MPANNSVAALTAAELNRWADFCRAHNVDRIRSSRRFQEFPQRRTTAKAVSFQKSMNASTVFPEDYPVHNDSHDRHSERGQGDQEQRSRRESRAKDIVGVDEVSRVGFLVPLFGEILGTAFLVIIGCASCINWGTPPSIEHIALTFGLAVASLAQALGPISGCHVNPAVTVGLLVSGNCSILKALAYVIIQCIGAVAGAGILKMALPEKATEQGLGMTNLGNGTTGGQGVLIEAMITFLLVLVVHATTDPRRDDCKGWAPLAIGFSISVCHMAAIPLTGSSMNPARSLGPAAVIGDFSNQWVYWIGPILGGVLAGGMYKLGLRAKSKDDEDSYDF